jgi:hypothetical protein
MSSSNLSLSSLNLENTSGAPEAQAVSTPEQSVSSPKDKKPATTDTHCELVCRPGQGCHVECHGPKFKKINLSFNKWKRNNVFNKIKWPLNPLDTWREERDSSGFALPPFLSHYPQLASP